MAMTWNKLTKQINSWLSFKRKAAESVNELPGLVDVQKRLFTAFMQALNDGNESEGKSRILKLAQKYGLDTRDAGIETIALLDIQAEDRMPEGVAAVNVMQVCAHPGRCASLYRDLGGRTFHRSVPMGGAQQGYRRRNRTDQNHSYHLWRGY